MTPALLMPPVSPPQCSVTTSDFIRVAIAVQDLAHYFAAWSQTANRGQALRSAAGRPSPAFGRRSRFHTSFFLMPPEKLARCSASRRSEFSRTLRRSPYMFA